MEGGERESLITFWIQMLLPVGQIGSRLLAVRGLKKIDLLNNGCFGVGTNRIELDPFTDALDPFTETSPMPCIQR